MYSYCIWIARNTFELDGFAYTIPRTARRPTEAIIRGIKGGNFAVYKEGEILQHFAKSVVASQSLLDSHLQYIH